MSQDLSLAMIDAVRVALEKATSFQEVKDVHDKAAAAETYAKQAKLGKEIEYKMAKYISLAEQRLGEMLEAGKAAGQLTHDHGNPKYQNKVVGVDDNLKFKLADVGISRDLSSRAQKLAKIPKSAFQQKIAELEAAGVRPSPNNILKAYHPAAKEKKSRAPKEHPSAATVINLHDKGLSDKAIAQQTGIPARQVRHSIEEEHIRRDERQKVPEILPDMLANLSDRKKVELAIKQQTEKLEKEYRIKVDTELRRRLELKSEEWRKERAEHQRVMNARRGFMTRVMYKKILACLHPDWVTDEKQKARYEEAFREFAKLEKCILDEKESPTKYPDFPKTVAEWEALKRQGPRVVRQHKADLTKR